MAWIKENHVENATNKTSDQPRATYASMRRWLSTKLSSAGIDLIRYSVEHTQHLLEVQMLAEIYNKKPIDVASDLQRFKLKETGKL